MNSEKEPSDLKEDNSLVGRVKRYARVSGTVSGLAAKLAGQRYLGIEINKDEHSKSLKEALGNLKGPLMKIAQLLATIPEALPKEYAMELAQLQSNAPAMGWPFVRRRMKTELGTGWQSKFKSFDKEASAAASLGQVHRAVSLDGQNLACKLQYPDMSSAIEADLKQLRLILGVFESYDKTVSTKFIQEELSARLREELDYTLEARFTKLYEYILRDEEAVKIPHVIDDLSTKRLISSTWLDGKPLLSFKEESLEVRNQIALNMFKAWYVPLYYYGMIHGDPHLGNYSIRDDYSINLLDFGCVRIFPARFVNGVLELYHALLTNDEERAVEAYKSWGFNNISKELVEVLNVWARFLYAPVMDDRVRKIGEPSTQGVYGRETAEKVHAELRKVGGVTVPQEFVFMDRAALGLGSVFLHLQAEINWYQLFNELTQGFDMADVQKRQNEALKKFDIDRASLYQNEVAFSHI
ncbi:MAG: ABC transporter ATP-binding protein [Rickettsiales bacterium]|nr:ABC transporter ATP-binding protein [Rickettsiales bacterium]|tara:strand:+ start:1669 stop:3072 length:1404 start_codon:yes stop_codon:yes gene_type:complete